MSTTTTAQNLSLEVRKLIKAPRPRVFQAWTKPEDIMKWFGPETCRALSAQVDLRTGGSYTVLVKTETMGEVEVTGVYREVKEPSRLVYTWSWNHPKMAFGETVVTVDFIEVNGWTEVRLRHDGFPAAEIRDNHNYGWTGCLDKLEKLYNEPSQAMSCSPVGEFSWNELVTTDMPGAAKFYTQLFGWKAEEFPMKEFNYTLFTKGETKVAGLMAVPHKDVPPHWMSYVTVESADESAKRVTELGGKVMAPPFDVPTVGRLAILMDPQGAGFAVFQPLKR